MKRIGVNAEASLFMQLHCDRTEYWGVVEGTAEVACEYKTFDISEKQSEKRNWA